jgi:hypothetical protein
MPNYWLTSKPAPDPPILDWLRWSGKELEQHIADSGAIVAVMGINKMGDIQVLYIPIIIPNALASGSSVIIGNSKNNSNELAFIYSDASDIGSVMVVMTYEDIPSELCPEEYLSSRILAETSWAGAKVKLGMVQAPMFAPIFFGQKAIGASIHDVDFKEKMKEISPIHHQWSILFEE